MTTLINACGAEYSGTTMLDLMLGNAHDAFSCGEVHAWFRPFRSHHFKVVCSCGKNLCPYWEKIKNFPENEFHRKVFEKLDVNFVIDSSKEILWILNNNRWAEENQIKVINLLIWKDPIDLIYSYWKRGRGLKRGRISFLKCYKRFFRMELPFISVSYNELAKNPQKKLHDICNIIGMKYFLGKERFWEKQHHYLFGSGGIRKQLENDEPKEIKLTEEFPQDFKKQLNYLHTMIENDREIEKIVQKLKRAEVSSVNRIEYEKKKNQIIKVYPMWYYFKKLKRIYKRHFPEPWPPDQ